MSTWDSFVAFLQRAAVAAGVVIASGVTVTVFGQVVPLNDAGQLVSWLLSSGIFYKFVQELFNAWDSSKSTAVEEVALGDKVMPF